MQRTRYLVPGTRYQVFSKHSSGQCNAMSSYVLLTYTTGTTYTFYEIEKRKEKQKHKQKRQIERAKEKNEKIKETICRAPPRRRGGQHLKNNELEKKENKNNKITKTPLLVNRVRQ